MGIFGDIGNAVSGVFGGIGGWAGQALGGNSPGKFSPYGAPTDDQRKAAMGYAGISSDDLNKQAQVAGQQQRQQNISGYNAAVASQRGVNPTLAAASMGNNLASANAQTGANTANVQAQNSWAAQQANQNMLMNYYAQQSSNYNTANGANLNAETSGANRAAGVLPSILGGVGGAAGSIAGMFGGGAAAAGSDKNEKQPIDHFQGAYRKHVFDEDTEAQAQPQQQNAEKQMAQEGPAKAEEFMDTLKPQSFQYKGDSGFNDGGQEHLGIMAQNLEKTPEGAAAVKDTPDGKMVDTNQLALMVAAAMGDLHQRLSKLEGWRKAA